MTSHITHIHARIDRSFACLPHLHLPPFLSHPLCIAHTTQHPCPPFTLRIRKVHNVVVD